MAPYSQAAELAETCFPGPDDGVDPAGDLEFAEDDGDIVADGLLAEVEAAGNGGVGVALGQQLEDVPLPFGQLRKGRCRGPGCGGPELLQHLGGDGGADDDLAVGQCADGAQGLLAACALDQVAACAGPDGGQR